MARTGFRITYATMSADNEELHQAYEHGLETARSWLDQKHPYYINGEAREGEGYDEERSPIDRDVVIGHFARATVHDVDDAVAAARAFAPEWGGTPWQERVKIMRQVADVISERVFELAALMAIEVGKSRLEALGDVEETADLIRYYCQSMENNHGFEFTMGQLSEKEHNRSVLRPYGVWAVISPFNFPMALSGGPSSGALVAGNCVVLKPSNQGALLGYKLYECYRDGGVPAGAFHLVVGRGVVAGEALWKHPDVGGITFTGSYNVGMDIYKNFSVSVPKPVICEMGGKNPTIVTKNADLDKATDGVLRSAFGFGGQKCSACSRVFVEREVYDDFLTQLKAKTEKIKVGNPLERDVYLGPIINDAALDTFEEAAEEARKNGNIVTGGQRITEGELGKGLFVEPTVVEAPDESWIWKKELFVPFVAVAPFDELNDAIQKANDTEYGLTAGFFSEDTAEVDEWLDRIQAGVIYVNRRAGSTTGAWPGVQPFGGWKGSGTTGKAGGGPYYVMQYLREQSRTVIAE